MAIGMIVSSTTPGAKWVPSNEPSRPLYLSYNEHGVHERPTDPSEEKDGYYFKEGLYAGLVLSTGEINGYDDSDFFATVWNEETGSPERVFYASTRGWTYPNYAAPDASPEIRAKYEAYCAAARRKVALERAAANARKVEKGKAVVVVRGRKVPLGFKGTAIWTGASRYGVRIGIRDENGKVEFTAITNVEVDLAAEFEKAQDEWDEAFERFQDVYTEMTATKLAVSA